MIQALEKERTQLLEAGLNEADLPFLLHQSEFRTGLLLLHGSAASPCNHRVLGQHLFGLGFTVYAPILTGHASPENLDQTSWLDCYHSAESALKQLATLVDRIFVIGSSFGGTLTYLLGVEHADKISGIVALSAPAKSSDRWQPESAWGAQIKECTAAAEYHLQNLKVPTLIMHGQDDQHVYVNNALSAYAKIPTQRKKLVLYDGIGHALGFGFNTTEVVTDIRHFIETTYPINQLTFSVKDHDYQQVNLAGEFNNWNGQDLPLTCKQDHWECTLNLQPGVYQYKLVIDGVHWILDPEADSVATPHGKRNSIFRVK